MRVMHQVTCCDDCPLLSEAAFCHHPLQETPRRSIWENDNDPDKTAPEWCPLRHGDLLLQLRPK